MVVLRPAILGGCAKPGPRFTIIRGTTTLPPSLGRGPLRHLLQWRADTSRSQGCAATAGCSGRRAHSSNTHSRRITPSACSDLISGRDSFTVSRVSGSLKHSDPSGGSDHAAIDFQIGFVQTPGRVGLGPQLPALS